MLREFRERRGLSRSELSRLTVRPGFPGVPEATITALEMKPGRVPDADIIEELSHALDIKPEELAHFEYPIAVARRKFKSGAEEDPVPPSRRRRAPLEAVPDTKTARRGHSGEAS